MILLLPKHQWSTVPDGTDKDVPPQGQGLSELILHMDSSFMNTYSTLSAAFSETWDCAGWECADRTEVLLFSWTRAVSEASSTP